MNKHKPAAVNQQGFITMMVCIIILVALVIFFTYKQVLSAQG